MPKSHIPNPYTPDHALLFADVIVAAFCLVDIPTEDLAEEMEITEKALVEILNDVGMAYDLDDFDFDDDD